MSVHTIWAFLVDLAHTYPTLLCWYLPGLLATFIIWAVIITVEKDGTPGRPLSSMTITDVFLIGVLGNLGLVVAMLLGILVAGFIAFQICEFLSTPKAKERLIKFFKTPILHMVRPPHVVQIDKDKS